MAVIAVITICVLGILVGQERAREFDFPENFGDFWTRAPSRGRPVYINADLSSVSGPVFYGGSCCSNHLCVG